MKRFILVALAFALAPSLAFAKEAKTLKGQFSQYVRAKDKSVKIDGREKALFENGAFGSISANAYEPGPRGLRPTVGTISAHFVKNATGPATFTNLTFTPSQIQPRTK